MTKFSHVQQVSRLGVFRDKRVLLHDYTPPRLPHRERELEHIKTSFEPVLCEDLNVKIHVYGKVGIGKNVLYNKLGEELEREAAKAGKRLLSVEEKIS